MLRILVSTLYHYSAAAPPSDLLPYPRSAISAGAAGTPVFVVSNGNLSRTEQVTVSTLAGVLARHTPSLYTLNTLAGADATDTTFFWLNVLKNTTTIAFDDRFMASTLNGNLAPLLTHFSANISGFVQYDSTTDSTNACLIRAAAEPGNVVCVGDHPTQALFTNVLKIKQIDDVSSSSPIEQFREHKSGLSTRMMASQPDDGGKSNCLSDIALLGRFPTIEHSEKNAAAYNEVIANFDKTKLNAALGWTGWDEHRWVSSLTKVGAVAHASDFASNLAFLSNVDESTVLRESVKERRRQRSAARAARRAEVVENARQRENGQHQQQQRAGAPNSNSNVHTVAFMTSDGDNIQLLQHVDFIGPAHYGSPLRGSVPVGWSYSPAMAALMPSVLGWVQDTLTVNDSISAGPSGAGYCYPQLFPADGVQATAFGSATAELMRRSEQTLCNVIGVTPSQESLAQLVNHTQIESICYFTFGPAQMGYAALHGTVSYVGNAARKIPMVGLRFSLWDGSSGDPDKVDVDGAVAELLQLQKEHADPSDPLSYSIVGVELGNNYSSIVEIVKRIQAAVPGGFDIVLPETLITKMEAATARKQTCPLASGPWARGVGDLPKCSIKGDGSCVMTCDDVGGLLPIPISCDLDKCSEGLSLSKSKLGFLCRDGTKCVA